MNDYNIDDTLDEEWDDMPIIDEDSISTLCFSIFDCTSGAPIGTGFIVDKNGLFVSAGHNFKTDNVKALFRGTVYDIQLLEKEYEEREPIEFAIGRLIDFNVDIPSPLFAINDDCNVGTKINLCGCKKDVVNTSEILKKITIPNGINIYKQRIERVIPEIKRNDPLFVIVKDSNGMAVPFEHHDQFRYLSGFSGGPAYIGNKIYGIITSHCYIKTDYWFPYLRKYQEEL